MLDKELLEMGVRFHGHKCPAMPIGIRAGLAAMKALGVQRASNKELFCACEGGPPHAAFCFIDGVQVATGCTIGKANIARLNYGKSAITLVEVKSRRAVRASVKPEFLKKALSSEFVRLRSQRVEPKDIKPELVDPLVEKVMSAPDGEILLVGEVFQGGIKPAKGTFESYECEKCGEIVFAHSVRIVDGKRLCIPCSGYLPLETEVTLPES